MSGVEERETVTTVGGSVMTVGSSVVTVGVSVKTVGGGEGGAGAKKKTGRIIIMGGSGTAAGAGGEAVETVGGGVDIPTS